jgi:hypothetical protein
VHDWRELRDCNISEASLPPGSIVHATDNVGALPLAVDGGLCGARAPSSPDRKTLAERYRRRSAQLESQHHLAQIIHLNRSAEVGALSASFCT